MAQLIYRLLRAVVRLCSDDKAAASASRILATATEVVAAPIDFCESSGEVGIRAIPIFFKVYQRLSGL